MSDLIDFQKNNLLGVKYPSFDGLTYINTYSVEAFKLLANCETLYVKALPYVNQLFFTYGCNIGFVAVAGVPNYEEEGINDVDNWDDPYGDEQAFYDGWSREDVESGLADAYEG